MGNTVLAHVLYSCQKKSFDLAGFFSPMGDAHNISKLSLDTDQLTAKHLLEYPDSSVDCLIELKSHDDWIRILTVKMGYDKWKKCYPTVSNYRDFFNVIDNNDKLWQDFYLSFKDPSWPDCVKFEHVSDLPGKIQEEIHSVYKLPGVDQDSVLNTLSLAYYGILTQESILNFSDTVEYQLDNYLNKNFDILKQVVNTKLGWSWNNQLSDEFYNAMIVANKQYFDWLDKFKQIFDSCIRKQSIHVELEFWERSALIAKLCKHFNITPNALEWNKQTFLLESTKSVIEAFEFR